MNVADQKLIYDMKPQQISAGELVVGPFRTEWFKQAVDDRLREAVAAFLQDSIEEQS